MRRQALLLLTTMALTLAVAGGTATAETQNGPIYYGCNRICSIDLPVGIPSVVTTEGNLFDISRDRETLVYQRSGFSNNDLGPFYTVPLSGAPYYYEGGSEVQISNLSASMKEMTAPRFSPDGSTIYFIGVHVVDPPEGVSDPTYGVKALYSVPTEGGEVTKIPIDWVNSDGSPRHISSFALSHDGSKFAINGPFGIFTVPVGGGVPTRVNQDSCGGAEYPSFSLDDRKIVYTSRIWSDDDCSGTSELTIYSTPADNDGTSPGTPLFPEDATDPSIYDSKRWPTFSPDGKYVAFSYWRSGSSQLATAPATGGSIKNIAGCVMCVPRWVEKLPDTIITAVPSQTVSSSSAAGFSFISDRSDATFECSLDGAPFGVCPSPPDEPQQANYSGLSEGSHTFEVRAVDSAGTPDPTPASHTWKVDTTVPTVDAVSPANLTTRVTRSTNVTATFSERMSQPTINGSTFTLYKCSSTTSTSCANQVSNVTVSLSIDGLVATLNPYGTASALLASKTRYKAVVTSGVTDEAGNPLDQSPSEVGNKVWYFITGSR